MADSAVEQTKTCSKCDECQSLDNFGRRARSLDGRQAWCSACMALHRAAWYLANRDKVNKRATARRLADPARHARTVRAWSKANRDKINSYDRQRYATPKGTIDGRMARNVRKALRDKKAGREWESLVGYTLADLMTHLEMRFLEGMSWSNIGEWHIDHVIPRAAFNYESAEHIDFRKCWSLSNLQPLWAPDNLKKSAKLTTPFQPSLAI